MKTLAMIELLQGIAKDHGDIPIKLGVNGPSITGIWIPGDESEADSNRHVALSIGTQTGRISCS